MKTSILLTLTLLLFAFLITPELCAQPPGMPANPNQAPIDGGLGLLAAASGAYALKKLRNRKKV